MASPASRCALSVAPAARPRPLRMWFAMHASRQPALLGRVAQQLHGLKDFKVWGSVAAARGEAARWGARGGRHPAPARQPTGTDSGERPGAAGGRRPGIVWFRGDLRLHDHAALAAAQAECSSLLPLYCFDPRDYAKSPQGYHKTGPCRAAFLAEAVADLRASLRAAGSDLIVRLGRPEEVVAEMVRRTGAATVYCHSEVTYEELRVEAAVKAAAEGAGAQLRALWANTLSHPEDLPFRLAQLPQNFDKFRQEVEGVAVRAALAAPQELRGLPLGPRVDPGDIPTLQQLGLQPLPSSPPAALAKQGGPAGASDSGSPRGGEGEALRQLQRFLAGAAARGGGGSPGSACAANFSSAIAPWLATGCLSPRRMLEDAQRALGGAASASAAAAQGAAQPLTWVRFELLWRDFFRFLTMRYSQASLPAAASPAAATA